MNPEDSHANPEDLTTWADRLEAVLPTLPKPAVDRIVVIAQTASTQDAAARLAAGRPGIMVLTGSQYAGRGRIGRGWSSGPNGLAVTFALPDTGEPAAWLSLAAGLAAYRALAELLPESASGALRVKRPNDVVLQRDDGTRLKLAGVLVERRNDAVLLGLGVNVRHTDADWPTDLSGRAASLLQLGAETSRIAVAEGLLRSVSAVWAMDQAAIELELASVLIG